MRRIVQPLGLRFTSFECGQLSGLAVGYTADGTPVWPPIELGWIAPAGQLCSSAGDLNAVLQDVFAAAQGGASRMGLRPATARALLAPAFLEADGRSLIGLPWEMRRHDNYTVLMKGGNLGGYTALLWGVPSMRLSAAVLLNGAADEFELGDLLSKTLVPPMAAALAALQPEPAPGPRPTDYVGRYACPAALGLDLRVELSGAFLLLSFLIAAGGTQNVLLDYFQDDLYRIAIPQGLLPCLSEQLNALTGEYVAFSRAGGGAVSSIAIPGYLGPTLSCARV